MNSHRTTANKLTRYTADDCKDPGLPQPQREHCEHECVCYIYAGVGQPCFESGCEYDTRTRPHTPAPEYEGDCDTCRFVKDCSPLYLPPCFNGNAVEAARTATLAYRKDLHKIISDLCDAGFKNPIVTFEAAVSYLDKPTIPGHPEMQKAKREKPKTKQEPHP